MSDSSYWARTRAPRHSLVFALPLLLAYEGLAFLLSGHAIAGVRNGADVLLKSLFVALGGRHGLALFGLALLGVGVAFVVRDRRRHGPIEPRLFGGMAAESLVYAALLGVVVGGLTSFLLGNARLGLAGGGPDFLASAIPNGDARPALAIGQQLQSFGIPTQIMISLGAGLYEELLFRVLLVSGISWLAKSAFGLSARASTALAVIGSALVFSSFHYVGPFGDPFRLDSFTFRAIAGLAFSGLYVARGFGIVAWSHAIYDLLLVA